MAFLECILRAGGDKIVGIGGLIVTFRSDSSQAKQKTFVVVVAIDFTVAVDIAIATAVAISIVVVIAVIVAVVSIRGMHFLFRVCGANVVGNRFFSFR